MNSIRLISLAFVSLLAAAGCSSDATSQDGEGKGGEDAPLAELGGKADSFFNPTMHGELRFQLPNDATIDADEGFHAWTFTLTDSAKLSLFTEVSQNLDTVMYLYRRQPGSVSWGSYKKKNDDWQGNHWSRIDYNAQPGEYRVIVKPYKMTFSGAFSVTAACEGGGCPTQSSGGPEKLPSETVFGKACAGDMIGVLTAPVTAETTVSVQYPTQRAALKTVERRAVDYYRDYASNWDIWSEPEVELNVEVEAHGSSGTIVSVDAFADEDVVEFVFDESDKLISYMHLEQSPTIGWFCGKASETALASEPDEDCWSLSRSLRHKAEDMTLDGKTGTTNVDDSKNGDLGLLGGHPAYLFAEGLGLSNSTELSFTVSEWSAGTVGHKTTFSYQGSATTYFGVQSSYNFNGQGMIVATEENGVTEFSCTEY